METGPVYLLLWFLLMWQFYGVCLRWFAWRKQLAIFSFFRSGKTPLVNIWINDLMGIYGFWNAIECTVCLQYVSFWIVAEHRALGCQTNWLIQNQCAFPGITFLHFSSFSFALKFEMKWRTAGTSEAKGRVWEVV